MTPSPLRRADLPEDPIALARFLLGRDVVRLGDSGAMIGRIVESEAYLPDDPASHSFGGPSRRNGSMYLDRGHAYVYRIYGMWHCLNVVAGARGAGAAVLIRALEPISGFEAMRQRRPQAKDRDLLRGPGRLCEALGIDLSLDGCDLCTPGALFLAAGAPFAGQPACSARIGISKAVDQMLRFCVPGSRFASGANPKPAQSKARNLKS